MRKNLNALLLTIISLVMFSCSDVPAPYDINQGGNGGPGGIEGEGTFENPFTVADARASQNGSVAWVQGYIVGCMGNIYDEGGNFAGNKAVFTAPFDVATNILIAASLDETNIKNCIPVKIKGGSALSVALNLKDTPANLGEALIIQGELKAGFGMPAMINTVGAFFKGETVGEGGDKPEPPVEGTIFFEESFGTNQGAFTIKNVTLPEGSDHVWKWDQYLTNPAYMVASANIAQANKASEGWLISPAIDLSKATSASLMFKHTHKFAGDASKEMTLWVTEAGKEAWAQLTIPTYGSGENWTFVSSGNIDLAAYVGKSMQFAFKYVSSIEHAPKWEINDVKVVGEGEGGGEIPEPPVEGAIFTEKFGAVPVAEKTLVSVYTLWDNPSFAFSASAKVDVRAITHKTEGDKMATEKVNNIWFPTRADQEFTIANIDAAGSSKFMLIYEAAANAYDAGASIDLNVLKVSFNGTDLAVPSKVVTNANGDANVFYEMKVEVNVAGTATSTLKFSAAAVDNTLGLRLHNVRLVNLDEGGGENPDPDPDPDPSVGNLLVNGGFEDWTMELPTGWDSKYNVGGSKATDVKHSGANSLLHLCSISCKSQQEVTVVEGKTYRISYWYLDNDPKAKSRMWSTWVAGTATLTDHAAELHPADYSVDSADWKQVTMTLVAPATATKFRFEVRSYKDADGGGSIYMDDFEVVEVK